MGIQVQWKDEGKTALVYIFDAHWTWDDFYKIKEEADALLDALDHPVPLVFDLRNLVKLPPAALSKVRTLTVKRHPNGEPIILVGMSPFIREILRLIQRILPMANTLYVPVATIDEAWAKVEQYHKARQ